MKIKHLLLVIVLTMLGLSAGSLKAQTTTSPDTVCQGATGVQYYVTGSVGSTYVWVVNGGTQATGGTSDTITVDWDNTTGTDTLKVVEISASGCPGDTQKLAVFRMPTPTATISGADTICYNNNSSFQVALTGIGPWDFTYTDGTTPVTVTGVTSSPYTVVVTGLKTTTTYTLVSAKNKFGCDGTVTGSATIVVNPKPTTSGIFHN
jgi:hypothetical protein